MRKQTLSAFSLALAACAAAPSLPAQNLQMAAPPAASASVARPRAAPRWRQVERQFGAPAERYPAVGQPPITRWVYPSIVVFFEYDHVVHAVALRR